MKPSNQKLKTILVFATLALFATGCQKFTDYLPNGTDKKSIAQIVSQVNEYKLLKHALVRAGLFETLNKSGTYTVFAPDNNAFAAAGFPDAASINAVDKATLKNILLYHVLGSKVMAGQIPEASNTPVATLQGKEIYVTKQDGKVWVNGSQVVKADIKASNGVIHAINRVLMPPSGNLVALAQSNTNLTYLVAAVLRASQGSTNVAAILSGDGPFTVFAPTNQAFINAGFPTIASINSADPNTLAGILTYHVIAARVFSSDLVDGASVPTANGASLQVQLQDGAKVLGNANPGPSNIIAVDLVATNGVAHVIDQVLLP